MLRFIANLLLTFPLSFAGAMAHGASFDCKLARSQIEKSICTNSSLSKLDEQLDALYTRMGKASGNERMEKALQHAWLKRRDQCTGLPCLESAYLSRIAEFQARSASTSPLVGKWEIVYSCEGATGIYEERCKLGDRNSFKLLIVVAGERVCAIHASVAQLGNRIDAVEDLEPSMTGKADGLAATVQFRSTWGGTGTATLRVHGNSLDWKVTAQDDGRSWIPDQAVLQRVPAAPGDRLPECVR